MFSAGDGPRAAGNSPSATSATSAGPSATLKRYGFPKSARLLVRSAFRRVYDQGSRVTSSSFAVFHAVRPASAAAVVPDPGGPRVGLTAPRALGNAVVRNRIKRRMREAIRLELPRFGKPVDYVFHPRRQVLDVPLPQLRREVERILRKCEGVSQ